MLDESTFCSISLLKTERPIEYNNFVQPIAFARREIRGSALGTIAGFGATVKELEFPPWLVLPPTSDRLMFITKRIAPEFECQSRSLIGYMRGDFLFMPFIYNQICTVAPVGTGICAGDSGSALVVGDVLVGIASYGKVCQQRQCQSCSLFYSSSRVLRQRTSRILCTSSFLR